MAHLYQLESSDPATFGVAILFDDGKPAVLTRWRHAAPLSDSDCLALAKNCAAHALDHLVRHGRTVEASVTNWASVTAAMQRHITDINEGVNRAAYAAGERDALALDAKARIELSEIAGGGLAGDARIH